MIERKHIHQHCFTSLAFKTAEHLLVSSVQPFRLIFWSFGSLLFGFQCAKFKLKISQEHPDRIDGTRNDLLWNDDAGDGMHMEKLTQINGQETTRHIQTAPLNPNRRLLQSDQAKLTVIRGVQNGSSILLGKQVTLIGRHEGWRIDDSLVSRRHMQISWMDNKFYLNDLNSTNGTYVNSTLVERPIFLQHGDVIQIGETILVFEVIGQESAVLGYGAKLDPSSDKGNLDTIKTRFYNQVLVERNGK